MAEILDSTGNRFPEPNWTTDDLARDYEVIGFGAPYVHVRRRADNVEGTLTWARDTDDVRRYFDFVARG